MNDALISPHKYVLSNILQVIIIFFGCNAVVIVLKSNIISCTYTFFIYGQYALVLCIKHRDKSTL